MKSFARNALALGGVLLGIWLFPANEASAETYAAKVDADVLNVRAEPASRASVIGSLTKGTAVTVSDEAYGWAQVKLGSKTGWVAAQYLVKTGTVKQQTAVKSETVVKTAAVTSASAAKEGVVTADMLWMREGPGTDSKEKELLVKGTRLAITGGKDGWLQVKTPGGAVGWVSERYVGQPGSVEVQSQKPAQGGLRDKVIVIDPGHGGGDPGVIGLTHKTEEKKINLSTAELVADELRRAGAKVIMTRKSDGEQPELSERAAVSNKQRADAFVSIHYNASPKKVSGTLVYYYSESKDRTLARAIEGRLAKGNGLLKSNGISFGDYHVLRENKQPAVLLELGFLTDSRDEATVRKDDYQRKAAAAIAAGLADYFGG